MNNKAPPKQVPYRDRFEEGEFRKRDSVHVRRETVEGDIPILRE